MNLTKNLLCALIIISANITALSNAHATIISYGGFTHDDTTEIVTGYGLEWLQWDRTLGESIESIQSQLDTIEGGGWSIATNSQMANLFNAFDFGLTFDTLENTSQRVDTGYTFPDAIAETDALFIKMFGDTGAASGLNSCAQSRCVMQTSAWFGQDLDSDGLYNRATVVEDYYHVLTGFKFNGYAQLGIDGLPAHLNSQDTGVALVRSVKVTEPNILVLLGLGLAGISYARMKKHESAFQITDNTRRHRAKIN